MHREALLVAVINEFESVAAARERRALAREQQRRGAVRGRQESQRDPATTLAPGNKTNKRPFPQAHQVSLGHQTAVNPLF